MPSDLLEAVLEIDMLANRYRNLHPGNAERCKLIRDAAQRIRVAVLNGKLAFQDDETPDPDSWVLAYISSGGDWQGLVAAVSRHSLTGSSRKLAS
jgi:hypothetical protein